MLLPQHKSLDSIDFQQHIIHQKAAKTEAKHKTVKALSTCYSKQVMREFCHGFSPKTQSTP